MVAQWLRYCATNRKVAGSIPEGVNGIFHWYNPSDRTMALRSTQPLTEMITRSIAWGWRRPVRRADNLTTMPLSCNLGTLTSWNPLGHSRPVTGLLYLYMFRALRAYRQENLLYQCDIWYLSLCVDDPLVYTSIYNKLWYITVNSPDDGHVAPSTCREQK
jgi:hypothetical protein